MTTTVITANIQTMSCCGSHYTLQQIKQWEMLLKRCECSVSFIAMSNTLLFNCSSPTLGYFFFQNNLCSFLIYLNVCAFKKLINCREYGDASVPLRLRFHSLVGNCWILCEGCTVCTCVYRECAPPLLRKVENLGIKWRMHF